MSTREKVSAVALLTVLVALLAVGLVSGTIVRHAVQTVPVLLASLVAALRPAWSRFAAIPVFIFWLFIMGLIWLYLLGLANVVTGHFTPAEVGLTVIIGLACVIGLAASARGAKRPSWLVGIAAFVMVGAIQVGAMWLSLQPALTSR